MPIVVFFLLVSNLHSFTITRYWVVFNGYDAIKEAHVDRGIDFMDRDFGYPSVWNSINFHDGSVLIIAVHFSCTQMCTQRCVS